MIIRNAASQAQFRAEKMAKVDLLRGEQMSAGLNCLEPGQEHEAHVHAGQDKLYFVLEGTGEFGIGEERETLGPGALALALSGVSHSVKNPGPARLVLLVVFAPPPAGRQQAQSGSPRP